jgi:hypothetical protein
MDGAGLRLSEVKSLSNAPYKGACLSFAPESVHSAL